ncbi:MAG: class I SAM-dependent methyltransferase [Pseudomonadota bacterium]
MTTDTNAAESNPYIDDDLADFYSGLDYTGTYHLAVRDLPDIIARQVVGRSALDFACGAGRSTRFLTSLGFDTLGVDMSPSMLAHARRKDPAGRYALIPDGELSCLDGSAFDLVHSAFPLGNATSRARIRAILAQLRNVLAPGGRVIVVESTEALYRHEWLSFSTSAYSENVHAKSGDPVRIAFRERMDHPVVDVLWADADYRHSFAAVGLSLLETHRPLVDEHDPLPWISERKIAPWAIYVLASAVGTVST